MGVQKPDKKGTMSSAGNAQEILSLYLQDLDFQIFWKVKTHAK